MDAPPGPPPAAAPLKRNAPLVPVDTASARALVAVIAIMTFLAALCADAAVIVAANAAAWHGSVSREATIQVRPASGRNVEADVARVAELARRTPGIADVKPFSKAEGERLLEPWLGAGLDLGDLPVPRLLVVKLGADASPDFPALRRALAEAVPGATLDDHGLWLARLSTMAAAVAAIGAGLVVLVMAATGLAVAFATRGAVAGNRDIVEVLHVVGAGDGTIARAFQARFFRLGLEGGAIGGAAALAAIAALGLAAASLRASPAGDQVEALFGSLEISPAGLAAVVAVALTVALVAAGVSRLTVRRFLDGPR